MMRMLVHILGQATTAATEAATTMRAAATTALVSATGAASNAATTAAAHGVIKGPDRTWELAAWYTLAALALIGAAVFAGNEIGIYSLSKVRLRLRTAKNEPNALLA